jgi:hypothetical protein
MRRPFDSLTLHASLGCLAEVESFRSSMSACGPLKSFTAEEERTQRFAEERSMFLCEPLRPSFLCGEVLNVFFGPIANARLIRRQSRAAWLNH